jgi:hypothetical protein
MVLRNFSPRSVITCHHSIRVVAYVERSVLLKIKSVKTPRIVLDSDENPECVETTPRVFSPVTETLELEKEHCAQTRVSVLKYKRIVLIFPLNGRVLNEPFTPSKLWCYSIFPVVKIP